MTENKIITKHDLINDLPQDIAIIENENLKFYNNKCFDIDDFDKSFFYSTYVRKQVNLPDRLLKKNDIFPIRADLSLNMPSFLEESLVLQTASNVQKNSLSLSLVPQINKDNINEIIVTTTKDTFNIFYLFVKGDDADANIEQKLYGLSLIFDRYEEDEEGNFHTFFKVEALKTDNLEFYGFNKYNGLIEIRTDYPLEIKTSPLLEILGDEIELYGTYQTNLDLTNLPEWTKESIKNAHTSDNLDDYSLKIAYIYPSEYEKIKYDYDKLKFNQDAALYVSNDNETTIWQKGEYKFPNKDIVINNNLIGLSIYFFVDNEPYYMDGIEIWEASKYIIVDKLDEDYYLLEYVGFDREIDDSKVIISTSNGYDYLAIPIQHLLIDDNLNVTLSDDAKFIIYDYNSGTFGDYFNDYKDILLSGFKANIEPTMLTIYHPEWFNFKEQPNCDLIIKALSNDEVPRSFVVSDDLTIEFKGVIYDEETPLNKYIYLSSYLDEEVDISEIIIKNIPKHELEVCSQIIINGLSINDSMSGIYNSTEIDYSQISYTHD